MAHLTCVGATVDELRAHARRDARRGHRERARPARRPAAGRGRVDGDRGRPDLLARAVELVRDDYDFAIGARLLPRDAHPRRRPRRTTCATPRPRSTRARSSSSRSCSSTTSAYFDYVGAARATPASTCRSCPGSCRSATSTRSSASPRCAARRIPDRLHRRARARARGPAEAVADLGVAYATLQCAELLAGGAPGIHFYTLNRSPATRAILGALRCLAPWRVSSAA